MMGFDPTLELWKAIDSRSAAGVAKALATGANILAKDWMGRSPALAMCSHIQTRAYYLPEIGLQECVELALVAGADPNASDASGMSALMFACKWGRLRAAKALIDAGADLDARDRWGRSALLWAAMGPWEPSRECADLLLSRGADPAARGNDGRDAIECSMRHGGQLALDWAGMVKGYIEACHCRGAMRGSIEASERLCAAKFRL